jgi:hypothetical protein
MQPGSYEKATGTIYGWLSNEHASLPMDTRFNSSEHSCFDISMIRMTPSLPVKTAPNNWPDSTALFVTNNHHCAVARW